MFEKYINSEVIFVGTPYRPLNPLQIPEDKEIIQILEYILSNKNVTAVYDQKNEYVKHNPALDFIKSQIKHKLKFIGYKLFYPNGKNNSRTPGNLLPKVFDNLIKREFENKQIAYFCAGSAVIGNTLLKYYKEKNPNLFFIDCFDSPLYQIGYQAELSLGFKRNELNKNHVSGIAVVSTKKFREKVLYTDESLKHGCLNIIRSLHEKYKYNKITKGLFLQVLEKISKVCNKNTNIYYIEPNKEGVIYKLDSLVSMVRKNEKEYSKKHATLAVYIE